MCNWAYALMVLTHMWKHQMHHIHVPNNCNPIQSSSKNVHV